MASMVYGLWYSEWRRLKAFEHLHFIKMNNLQGERTDFLSFQMHLICTGFRKIGFVNEIVLLL
jgi:hypothetical protein